MTELSEPGKLQTRLSRFSSSLEFGCSRCSRLTLLRLSDKTDGTGAADAIFFCNDSHRHSRQTVADKRSMVNTERRTSESLAFHSRPSHSGFDALDDQRPFEFGNRANQRDEHPTYRAACVDGFACGYEFNFEVAQFINDFEKILRAPGNPIERSDQDNRKLSTLCVGHHGVQPRTPRLRAGDSPVAILSADLKASLRRKVTEVV
jgi:hypothetical protein